MKSKIEKLSWQVLRCSQKELRLDITLKCGQSFRWKTNELEGETCYVGVLHNQVVVMKQDEENICYASLNGKLEANVLTDYFNLSVNLEELYSTWSKVDPIFLKISSSYPGVRMLRQDPVENLFSFICSANNNIQRIQGMVEKMAKEYGSNIGDFEGETYYTFPTVEALAQDGVEDTLRKLGFGYRAKYIEESARRLISLGGEKYLYNLRDMEYKEARENLLTLSGIGPKVADCILLMSLDQPSAVPVDTHVFQIAKQYLPHLNTVKTVTSKVYSEIGDFFRELYGEYAGWAHSVLFSADLRHLKNLQHPESHESETNPESKPEKGKGEKLTNTNKNSKNGEKVEKTKRSGSVEKKATKKQKKPAVKK